MVIAVMVALFFLQLRADPPTREATTSPASNVRVWSGHIETAAHWVTPPPGHVRAGLCGDLHGQVWTPSASALDAILDATVPASSRARLVLSRSCQPDGCNLRVSAEAYRALPRDARGAMSRAFGQWSSNTFYAMPMHRPAGRPRFDETPGLPDDARAALRAVSWDDLDGGDSVSRPGALCDVGLPEASLVAALRALWTIPTVDVAVRVDHDDALEGVARYWAWGRDPGVLAARLRAEGAPGRAVSLRALLPERVASLINSYAPREDDRHNCLNAVLCDDGRCPDMLEGAEAEARLTQDFRRVETSDGLRAGDVVVWRDEGGQIVHGAAWLADRLLFTKNGVSYLRPWHVAPFDAIQRGYRHATRAEYWRRNGG